MRERAWSEAARALGWAPPSEVAQYQAEIARLNGLIERCGDLHGRVVRAEQTVLLVQGQLAKLVTLYERGTPP